MRRFLSGWFGWHTVTCRVATAEDPHDLVWLDQDPPRQPEHGTAKAAIVGATHGAGGLDGTGAGSLGSTRGRGARWAVRVPSGVHAVWAAGRQEGASRAGLGR